METRVPVHFIGASRVTASMTLFAPMKCCSGSHIIHYTVYLEIFARRNFRELPAELNFRVFIFANGDLTIYIVYIGNDLY